MISEESADKPYLQVVPFCFKKKSKGWDKSDTFGTTDPVYYGD